MEWIEPLIRRAVERPEQSGAVIVGVLSTLFHYNRTGRLPIGRLPFRALRSSFRELRQKYARRPRPKGVPGMLVSLDPREFVRVLREESNFEGASAAFDYTDELIDLRLPAGIEEEPGTGDPTAMELHVRGFLTESDDLWLIAHYEASRYEETGIHLEGSMLSWSVGREKLASVLDSLDVGYRLRDSERSGEVVVVPPEDEGVGGPMPVPPADTTENPA